MYCLLTCHKRENDIDIHLTSSQLTLVERTLDFISWGNESISPPFLFSFLPPLPVRKFAALPLSLIPLANTLLNYHVLSGYPVIIMLSAFLLPAVVNSVVARGEIRYQQSKSQERGGQKPDSLIFFPENIATSEHSEAFSIFVYLKVIFFNKKVFLP